MPVSNEPGRSSLSRSFAILHACRRGTAPMTLTELSRRSGIPAATAYRLSLELIAEGALERNDDGTLQIGIGLWELGSAAPRQRGLRRAARPVMQSLAGHTDTVVQLAVAGHHEAVCVEKITGSRAVVHVTEVAGSLPLHSTGVGKVILAYSDDPGVRAILQAASFHRYNARTIANPGRLATELAGVRAAQVGYSRGELTPGTASVAAPVFDAESRFVAALGVLTPEVEQVDRLAPEVRRAADAISRRLHVGAPRSQSPGS
ncbi:IclR family transcriptional regulator [Streptomyces plumbiresistens]|uniref:IclR family transcriptional regulator n=1 Tax=Streptomyces plumbiresistens TaxID=511811 RepID=A0ABP7QNG1_9ACTN